MIELEISKEGRAYCEVYIKPFDSQTMKPVFFKIDTGADYSTISKDVLHTLGYTNKWIDTHKVSTDNMTSTASGEAVASVYVPLSINVYGIEGVNYPFGVLLDEITPLPKQSCADCEHVGLKKRDYRLLLGNDLLSCFDIRTERDNNLMFLEARQNFAVTTYVFQNLRLTAAR